MAMIERSAKRSAKLMPDHCMLMANVSIPMLIAVSGASIACAKTSGAASGAQRMKSTSSGGAHVESAKRARMDAISPWGEQQRQPLPTSSI
eukprot:7390477-Prymnesium_polylepis.1